MTRTYIVVLALFVALVAGIGTAPPLAQADVDGSVAIGCEFLVNAIDGNTSDVASGADAVAACDGISSTGDNPLTVGAETGGEAETLAEALGDEDAILEASDFVAVDLDANQIREYPVTGITNSTYVFAFVDDDSPVTFDAHTGLAVSFGVDEICDTLLEDADCDTSIQDDGDGVVVATITAAVSADAGDELDVTIIQEGDDHQSETIIVTGAPNEVTLILVESPVQQSSNSDFIECKTNLDVMDSNALSNANSTIAIAVVVDNDDVELTRVSVQFDSADSDIADIGDTSGISIDRGTSGIAAFAVICGGIDLGGVQIVATIQIAGGFDDTSAQTVTVVGEPATIALAAAPAEFACDGVQSTTLTATVTDSSGQPVANGTNVNFGVVANATANPINTTTLGGVASSEITPIDSVSGGVTVLVSAGDAQASIRIDCESDGDDPSLPVNVATLPFSDFRLTNELTHAPGEPQPCGNVLKDVWYQLTIVPSPPFNATIVANTIGSNFNTVVAAYVYTGAGAAPTVAESALLGCNATGANSSVTLDVAAGNTYFFQVGGANGASGGLQFNIQCATDADCDTVADAADNCMTTSNVAQVNTDNAPIVTPGIAPIDGTNANGDGLGDACDVDDDNDDLVDEDETSGAPCASAAGTTNPLRADTDGDRVLDGAECAMGVNPNSALSKPANPMPNDADGDGLSNALEGSIGSNPAVVDTDGDGINDGIEFRGYGTSLVATDSDGDGCADDTEIADVSGSRKVDIVDIFLVAGSVGLTTRPNFDISKDGTINIVDLFLVAANVTQGFCPP